MYGFERVPRGIEHALAYQALEDGAIDVTDAYSTDGELVRYDLKVLTDDRHFFPTYLAAPLVRADLPAAAKARLAHLADTLDDAGMQAINASVMFGGADFAEAAAGYLDDIGIESTAARSGFWEQLRRNTVRHILLTAIALAAATCVGIALGLLVFRVGWLSRAVVYMTGLMQTIPSIALLALMIPLFGIGVVPAIAALFMYSLLPIVRNTVTALVTVDPVLRRVSLAMGLTRRQELRHVFVPVVDAEHAGGRSHGGGHLHRHGDARGVHRRRRVGRPDRHRPEPERHGFDHAGSRAGGPSRRGDGTRVRRR